LHVLLLLAVLSMSLSATSFPVSSVPSVSQGGQGPLVSLSAPTGNSGAAPRFLGDDGTLPLGADPKHFTNNFDPSTGQPKLTRKDNWCHALGKLSEDKMSSMHKNLDPTLNVDEFEIPLNHGFKTFADAIKKKHSRLKDSAPARAKVEAAQQRGSNLQALLQQMLVEAGAQQDDLTSAAREMGGIGKQPTQQVLPTGNGEVCAICLKGPDDGNPIIPGVGSIHLTCGHAFHAACWHKHSYNAHPSSQSCPVCRDPLAPVAAAAGASAAADAANDDASESDDVVCQVCLDGTYADNNPILMCSGPNPTQHGSCDVAMHQNCLIRPPASSVGVNCWCLQHWSRASQGDIKLNATGATTTVPTTASDRAARMEKKKQAADAGSSSKDNGSCFVLPKKKMKPAGKIFFLNGKKKMKPCAR